MKCLIATAALSLAGTAFAIVPEASLRAGAQALALGEAGAAALQGDEASWWNAAGLPGDGAISLSMQGSTWPGLGQGVLQVGLPLGGGRFSAWGMGTSSSYAKDALGGGAAYGRELGDGVRAGLAMAYFTREAAEPELLFQPAVQATWGPLVFGMAFNEPGVGKRAWQGSVAWNRVFGPALATLSGGYLEQGKDSRYGGGLELAWQNRFFLRGGYEALSQAGPSGLGASAGLGARLGSLGIDYGWQGQGPQGSAHRLSLSWRFRGTAAEELPDALAVPGNEALPLPPRDPDTEKTGQAPAAQ